MNTINQAKVIIGTRVGKAPASDLSHFYTCSTCGQSVDMHDLGQVFYHEEEGHKPIPPDA